MILGPDRAEPLEVQRAAWLASGRDADEIQLAAWERELAGLRLWRRARARDMAAIDEIARAEDEFDALLALAQGLNAAVRGDPDCDGYLLDDSGAELTSASFDLARWLGQRLEPFGGVDSPLLRRPEGRRALTQCDPLLFALVYLPHHLKTVLPGDADGAVLSFADFHLDLAREARGWVRPVTDVRGPRDCYVAPRSAGKSTWCFLLLPMWAAAHGHERFIAAFADSATQAEIHLMTFRQELENNELLRQDFPELCKPAAKLRSNSDGGESGLSLKDNQNMYIAQSGFVFAARGVDTKTLGLKVGDRRPDMILCHAVGTPMWNAQTRQWHPVEGHSSFRGLRVDSGLKVTLWGLPEPETVTTEHRYWARMVRGAERYEKGVTTWDPHAEDEAPGWVEARNLTTHHWIGSPIDTEESDFGSVGFWSPVITHDPETARIVTSARRYVERIPDEFYDPDWWWFFGLWWGDGSANGRFQVKITANNNDARIIARVENLLSRYGIRYHRRQCIGCIQIIFSRAHLCRWLQTWKVAPSQKQPPVWVEQLPVRYLRELVWGYVDADGFVDRAAQAVRVTSIYLPGLLALRRILARLGAAASIRRSGGKPGMVMEFPAHGKPTMRRQKYDLRVRQGAAALGFPFADQDRYDEGSVRTFVADGMLWTRVRSVEDAGQCEFAPIKTDVGTYVTHFGLSHNCDDIEPDESNYSVDQVAKRLRSIIDAIFPLNLRARVVLVGTVVMPGSIIHQLVEAGRYPDAEETPDTAWIREQAIVTHYYAPIVETFDEASGETGRRSIWPAKWPLEFLEEIESTRDYLKNFANDPLGAAGTYWTVEDFGTNRVGAELQAQTVASITHQLLAIDPAVTTKKTSDFTALAVVGFSAVTRRCVVRDAWAVRVQPGRALRQLVVRVVAQYPQIRGLVIESNQGGDVWYALLGDLGLPIETVWHSEHKEVRAARLLDKYQRGGRCFHERPLRALEQNMVVFPRGSHDDLVDTVGTGVEWFLDRPKPQRGGGRSVGYV